MARTWWSIRVELVSGRGDDYWPRPGRIFAVARSHTFGHLAAAVDIAFARWDRAHMSMFTLTDGTTVTPLRHWAGDPPDDSVDSDTTKLSRLQAGDRFAYTCPGGDRSGAAESCA